jgi:hypothetical protein
MKVSKTTTVDFVKISVWNFTHENAFCHVRKTPFIVRNPPSVHESDQIENGDQPDSGESSAVHPRWRPGFSHLLINRGLDVDTELRR